MWVPMYDTAPFPTLANAAIVDDEDDTFPSSDSSKFRCAISIV